MAHSTLRAAEKSLRMAMFEIFNSDQDSQFTSMSILIIAKQTKPKLVWTAKNAGMIISCLNAGLEFPDTKKSISTNTKYRSHSIKFSESISVYSNIRLNILARQCQVTGSL